MTVAEIIGDPAPKQVPLVSWVSAGRLRASHPVFEHDVLKIIEVSDLPAGNWMALEIEGDSMDRIAPSGSVIFVDRNDDRLIDGRCYVFGNNEGETTFKRFRSNPDRMQPYSTNPDHETHYIEDEIKIIGRVRKIIKDI